MEKLTKAQALGIQKCLLEEKGYEKILDFVPLSHPRRKEVENYVRFLRENEHVKSNTSRLPSLGLLHLEAYKVQPFRLEIENSL